MEPEGNLYDKIKAIPDNDLATSLCDDEEFVEAISVFNNNETLDMESRKEALRRVFMKAGHEIEFKMSLEIVG